MADNRARKDVLDNLVGWMENLEGASPEDLRAIRLDLGHDVEADEASFLSMLREKSREAGIKLEKNTTRPTELNKQASFTAPLPKKRLLILAKEQGFSTAQHLAEAAQLSVVLVKMLDRGLIEVGTIPHLVINNLAFVVKHPVEFLIQCLQIPPRLTPGLKYKADVTPELEKPKDFFEAVLTDPTLPKDRSESLLSLKNKK
jgi:hypothetical protein